MVAGRIVFVVGCYALIYYLVRHGYGQDGDMLKPEDVWQIEKDLSSPLFRGVPIGSALASLWHIEVYGGNGDWSLRQALKNWARCYYHYFRRAIAPPPT